MHTDLEAFEQLVSHLNCRWKLHRDLFQGSEQYILFNQSGSNIWSILRESLLDSIFMDISRLLDPKSSFGKDNISIERFLSGASNGKYAHILGNNYTESIILYKRLIQPWRNQRLSHNDLNTITGQTGLPDVNFSDLDVLIGNLNEVVRFILLSSDDVDRDLVPSVTNKAWTPHLFRVLGAGVDALAAEIKKDSFKFEVRQS